MITVRGDVTEGRIEGESRGVLFLDFQVGVLRAVFRGERQQVPQYDPRQSAASCVFGGGHSGDPRIARSGVNGDATDRESLSVVRVDYCEGDQCVA